MATAAEKLAEREAAVTATEAEADERADALQAREDALADRGAAMDTREATLTAAIEEGAARALALDERSAMLDARSREIAAAEDAIRALDDRESACREREVALANRVTGLVPTVQPGNGLALIELPAQLVGVLAALHPAEHASVAAQTAGLLTEALAQTGKADLLRDKTLDADLATLLLSQPATPAQEIAPLVQP